MAELVRVCRPFDWIRIIICTCMAAGIVLSVLFAGNIVAISPLGPRLMWQTMWGMIGAVPIFYFNCKVINRIFNR